jgi:hypothetical protein
MLHIQFLALAFSATALAVSGCGGSSKAGSTATAGTTSATTVAAAPPPIKTTTVKVATGRPLTRAALISRADAICARKNAEIASLSVGNEAEFRRVIPQSAIYYRTESNELLKLVPPASLTSDWSRIINSLHLFNEYVSQVVHASQTGQRIGPLLHTAELALHPMSSIARHDGFKQCSK